MATATLLGLGQRSSPDPNIIQHDPQTSKSNFDQATGFWECYNKAADFEDREFVKTVGGNLDGLLIFAGLFSGVNTAFISEAVKTLQLDQATKTNELIRSVILVHQNATVPTEQNFTPSPQNVRSTALFFASLCCSVSAAFGAVLGKQWLNHYESEGGLKPPPDRGRERQKKYESRSQWHLEGIVETLPMILQLSVFLFLAALSEALEELDRCVRKVVMGFSLVLAIFYGITLIIATIFPLAPFQTRLSIVIHTIVCIVTTLIIRSVTRAITLFTIHTTIPNIKRLYRSLLNYPLQQVRRIGLANLVDTKSSVVIIIVSVASIIFLFPPYLLSLSTLVISRWVWNFVHTLILATWFCPDIVSELTLNLGCLIFLAEKASTPEDFDHLFQGMDALPIYVQLAPSSPILSLLGDTLIKFVIKPTDPLTSTLRTMEFKHLLKPLHLLYMSWRNLNNPRYSKHSSLYFRKYTVLIRRSLVDTFMLDPQNVEAASLIADMLDATNSVSESEDAGGQTERIKDHISLPRLTNEATLPFARLLATSLSSENRPAFPQETNVAELVPLLLDMIGRGTLAVNHVTGRIWAEVLPDHLEASSADMRFSGYLADCCRRYIVDGDFIHGSDGKASFRWGPNHPLPHYLRAVQKLLQRHPENTPWDERLEQDGFFCLLLEIVQQASWPSSRGLAVLCFISLWHKRQQRNPNSPPPAINLPLTPSTVKLIVQHISDIETVHNPLVERIDPAFVSQTMTLIMEYLETASELGLLKHSMVSLTEDYKFAGNRHLANQQERQDIYSRLERMNFV